jgi:aminoglycoside 3-N-acetyltransferase
LALTEQKLESPRETVGAGRVKKKDVIAGRAMFLRWAIGPDGQPAFIETGGCSEGFPNLEPALAPVARETHVGNSRWRAFDAATALQHATAAIRNNPNITHCADPNCPRCRDAVLGGPSPPEQ